MKTCKPLPDDDRHIAICEFAISSPVGNREPPSVGIGLIRLRRGAYAVMQRHLVICAVRSGS